MLRVIGGSVHLTPAVSIVEESQTQRIVMNYQMPHRLIHDLRIASRPHFEHRAEVPMMRVLQVQIEEPTLDRRERNGSGHCALVREVNGVCGVELNGDLRKRGNRRMLEEL